MIDYNIISLLVGAGLVILAWLDLKKKEIPSFLTTTLILIIAILKIENLEYGVYGLLFAIILWELSYIKGLADIKIIFLISLTLNTFIQFSVMMVLIMILGLVWQTIFIFSFYKTNKTNLWKNIEKAELPFIPVLAVAYIILKIIF